jgi:hypothetical protein
MRRYPAIVLGKTADGIKVSIPQKYAYGHIHLLGSPGMGKSKVIENMIWQNIVYRLGGIFIDPHGHSCDNIIRRLETVGLDKERKRKILILYPSSGKWSFGFNPLAFGDGDPQFSSDCVMEAVSHIWSGEDTHRTPTLRRRQRNMYQLMNSAGLTIADAPLLIGLGEESDRLRRYLVERITDPILKSEWNDLIRMNDRQYREEILSLSNRLAEIAHTSVMRNMLGQTEDIMDMRRYMDEGYVILVNLACKGILSPINSRIIGTLLLNEVFLKALSRPDKSRPFYCYVDECQFYLNAIMAQMLDQIRKFGVRMVLSHQHLGQLRQAGEAIYGSVMADTLIKIIFGGLPLEDAQEMADQCFEYDLEEYKPKSFRPLVVGEEKEILVNGSETDTVGGSSGAGKTVTAAKGTNRGKGTTEGADGPIETIREGDNEGESLGTTNTTGENWARSVKRGWSETRKRIYELMGTESYKLADQRYRCGNKLRRQDKRHAHLQIGTFEPIAFRTQNVPEGYASDADVERFMEERFSECGFAKPTEFIQIEIAERQKELLQKAGALVPVGPKNDDDDFWD